MALGVISPPCLLSNNVLIFSIYDTSFSIILDNMKYHRIEIIDS